MAGEDLRAAVEQAMTADTASDAKMNDQGDDICCPTCGASFKKVQESSSGNAQMPPMAERAGLPV